VAAIGQIQAAATQSGKEVEHRKIEVSFRYMVRWNEPGFRAILPDAVDGLNSVVGKSPEQMQAVFEGNAKQREAVMSVFNLFEDIGLAVRTGYADSGSLCQYFSEPASRYFSKTKPWLEYYRQQTGRHGAYEQYEWLCQKWDKGCPVGSLQK